MVAVVPPRNALLSVNGSVANAVHLVVVHINQIFHSIPFHFISL
jgi:hypothetical protein